MKSFNPIRSIVAACIAFSAMSAHAQIPVTDIAHIAVDEINQVAVIAQWAAQAESMYSQYQQLVQQYNQAVTQYNAITGSRGMGGLLNNPAIASILPQTWDGVLSTIKGTAAYTTRRAAFPTSSNPQLNALYDLKASQAATMDTFFQQTNQRLAQTQSLMGQIDSASDPAAKDDLHNRLVSETNAINGTQQLLKTIQAKHEQDVEAAETLARKEFRCNEFKIASCMTASGNLTGN
jgi:type IV secretion system protein VirB5